MFCNACNDVRYVPKQQGVQGVKEVEGVRLLFVWYTFMMNIRNLGSKESLVVIFKDGICTKLCVKLWFESDWYFCNITESGWF